MASLNAQPETQILKILKLLTIVIAIIEKIGICRLPDVYNILLISETIIEIWTIHNATLYVNLSKK